jgi:hypothetical protein
MTGIELWQRKSDDDVLDAVSRFHEYDETGQAILVEEMRRRGLSFPPDFGSSCLNCGVPFADGSTSCSACGAGAALAGDGLLDEPVASLPAGRGSTIPSPGADGPFFEVATGKFLVMSVCTLGLYSLYWFYQNWKHIHRINDRIGTARNLVVLSALLRTFFAPFWAYALFREVRTAARAAGVEIRWRPWLLAIGYVVSNLLYRLPNQASLFSLVGVLFLLPVQQTMERVNRLRGSGGERNAGYSATNIVWIVLGVSILLTILLGPALAPPAKTPQGVGNVRHETERSSRDAG